MKVRFEYRADGEVGPATDSLELEMPAVPCVGDYVDINDISYDVDVVHWEILSDKVWIRLRVP